MTSAREHAAAVLLVLVVGVVLATALVQVARRAEGCTDVGGRFEIAGPVRPAFLCHLPGGEVLRL